MKADKSKNIITTHKNLLLEVAQLKQSLLDKDAKIKVLQDALLHLEMIMEDLSYELNGLSDEIEELNKEE